MQFRHINNLPIEDERLSPATIKAGKKLQARIDALQFKRTALIQAETELANAPLNEVQDWSAINRTYAELIADEWQLLTDLLPWHQLRYKDEANYKRKMGEALNDEIEAVKEKLISIGYTPECFMSNQMWLCHPQVKHYRLESERYPDRSDIREHIEKTETELKQLRQKRIS